MAHRSGATLGVALRLQQVRQDSCSQTKTAPDGALWVTSDEGSDFRRLGTIDPAIPVIFLETGKHFPETLQYRDTLIEKIGLENYLQSQS